MEHFAEEYRVIYDNLKIKGAEKMISDALERINQKYLETLAKGVCEQVTNEVSEATRQIAYVKAIMERQLNKQNAICRMFFQAGISVGQSKAGDVWLQEQENKKCFEKNMLTLLSKAHVKKIIKTVYESPVMQHDILAQIVGISSSRLSKIITGLEESGCLRRYGTRKNSFYELTLDGKDYVKRYLKTCE